MNIFTELSSLILIAIIVVGIVRLLKQPLIIGYIITGILVSPIFLNLIKSVEIIETFSQLGIALLLFMVGLNLNPKTMVILFSSAICFNSSIRVF